MRCPNCESTDLSFDYAATITARVVNGKVRHIIANDALQGVPTLFCNDCYKTFGSLGQEDTQLVYDAMRTATGDDLGEPVLFRQDDDSYTTEDEEAEG